jgi:hypothetical protein
MGFDNDFMKRVVKRLVEALSISEMTTMPAGLLDLDSAWEKMPEKSTLSGKCITSLPGIRKDNYNKPRSYRRPDDCR